MAFYGKNAVGSRSRLEPSLKEGYGRAKCVPRLRCYHFLAVCLILFTFGSIDLILRRRPCPGEMFGSKI